MSEALRLAEDLRRQFMDDDHNFDTMIEASIELRRLAAVEQELEALKRAISEAEPVAWSVEGWSGAKRIATSLHHSVDDAKTYAAEFSQHYPTIHTLPLYTLKGIK